MFCEQNVEEYDIAMHQNFHPHSALNYLSMEKPSVNRYQLDYNRHLYKDIYFSDVAHIPIPFVNHQHEVEASSSFPPLPPGFKTKMQNRIRTFILTLH
jgi:hypothetical protein